MGLADQWNNHVDHIVETADRLGNSTLLGRFFACLYAYCNLEERCLAMQEWKGFNEGVWQKEINVRDFIQKNYQVLDFILNLIRINLVIASSLFCIIFFVFSGNIFLRFQLVLGYSQKKKCMI